MSLSNCQSKISSNSNLNEINKRFIIAKAYPPNSHSDINLNSNNETFYDQNKSQLNVYSSNGFYLENNSQSLTHTTGAPPTTVEWLVQNFEPGDDCSIRRSTLYSFYLQHCFEQKLDSLNQASFGKLMRAIFLGLKTRRLGARGNSKYHYYGIGIKKNSNLNNYSEQHHQINNQQSLNLNNEDFSNENRINSNLLQNSPKRFLILNCSIILPDSFNQINFEKLNNFQNSYKDYCQKLFDVIIKYEFDSVEQICLNYWSSRELNLICSLNYVINFIINCDYQFYEQVIQILIPNILSPITGTLTQSIRSFGKNIIEWMNKSLNFIEQKMKKIKLIIVNVFSMILKRYTSLNHLAQAARSVLNNSTHINQMLADLNKVDFHYVQEQAWWICECDQNIVSRIEKEFKKNLFHKLKLEEWCEWIDLLLNDLLQPYSNISEEIFLKKGKEILLNWSFYCSIIIRDLTLRSASSFGSFHLIRLLFDEYLFYLIQQKISLNKQTTSIEVIAKLTLENKLSTSNIFNERPNIPSKVSFLKKDSLSQNKIVTLPNGNIQLPIFNKLSNQSDNKNLDSVKRFKRNYSSLI